MARRICLKMNNLYIKCSSMYCKSIK